jgi:uncharacterized membrane protein YqiK
MMRRTFLTSALDMPEIMSYIYSKSWKLQFSASSSIIIIEDYYLQTFLHSLIFIPVVLIISLLVFVIWYFWVTPYNLSDALLTMCGVLVPKDRKHLIQVLRISHVQKDYTQLVADGFAVSYPRTAGTRRPDYSRAHFSSIEFVSSVYSHKLYV